MPYMSLLSPYLANLQDVYMVAPMSAAISCLNGSLSDPYDLKVKYM